MRRILASAMVLGALMGAAAASPANAAVVPNSASGCNLNGWACISVNGSGLHVNWVEASTQGNFTGHYRIYNTIAGWSSSSSVKVWIARQFGGSPWHLTINANQPNNSRICVSAYDSSNRMLGNACETIHS